jgi:hypothetical protein
MFTEVQTKQQKLKKFLDDVLGSMQTKPNLKFCSPDLFDEELPAFNLTARTIRDVINELSEFYGFTYVIRPDQSESTPTLCFLRTGKAINNQAISLPLLQIIQSGTSSHHVQWNYNTVTVGLTDGVGEAKKKPLRTDSFRKPLSTFSSGEKMKSGFQISLPELEISVPHPDLYSRAEKLLPYQHHLSEQMRDSQNLILPEPKVQVGDLIQLKDAFPEYQNDASYLVRATRILIQGAQPKLHVIAVRP